MSEKYEPLQAAMITTVDNRNLAIGGAWISEDKSLGVFWTKQHTQLDNHPKNEAIQMVCGSLELAVTLSALCESPACGARLIDAEAVHYHFQIVGMLPDVLN